MSIWKIRMNRSASSTEGRARTGYRQMMNRAVCNKVAKATAGRDRRNVMSGNNHRASIKPGLALLMIGGKDA